MEKDADNEKIDRERQQEKERKRGTTGREMRAGKEMERKVEKREQIYSLCRSTCSLFM